MKINDGSLLVLFILLFGCSNVNQKSGSNDSALLINLDTVVEDIIEPFGEAGLCTFDVTKSYPEKEISVQSIAEVEYIPLETRGDMLMRRKDTRYLDENEIIATNGQDVMFFNRDGSALYSFNRKGGSGEEYSNIFDLVYDKKNEEIFILDYMLKRIRVYSKKGVFKRTFNVKSPKGKHVEGLLSWDDNSLLCFSPEEPIMFVSKKDGHVSKTLRTSSGKTIEMKIRKEDGFIVIVCFKFYGRALDGYMLTDISSDSTFILVPNNELKLFSIRKPSVHKMEVPVVFIPCLETSNYYFASTVKKEYDFANNIGYPYEYLMYDKKENKIYTPKLYNSDYTNKEYFDIDEYFTILAPGQFLIGLRADKLIEDYQNNKLKGNLKEIASKLKEDDNPVLMLMKFK